MSVRLLEVRTLHDGFTKLVVGRFRIDGESDVVREIVDHGDSVAILPYDPQRRVAVLTRQFRAPVQLGGEEGFLLEAPAWRVEEEGAIDTARRELVEEIGIAARDMEHVATAFASPGILNERIHLFLAAFGEGDRVGAGGGVEEESENIEPVLLPLGELAAMARRGEIADLKTLALVLALQSRRPDLFTR
jgi:nudix-type nucleoside diphosphatase (YffH/AdpP family)